MMLPQVEFCVFDFYCVLTAGAFTVTACALPNEFFFGVRAGNMRSAQCNNTLCVVLHSGLGHVLGLEHFLNM